MKRRKYGNNTGPILSVLTPYRTSLLTTPQTTKKAKRRGQPGSDPRAKRRRVHKSPAHSHTESDCSEQEVRRELGLDTDQLIVGSSDSGGEDILFLDDGYQVG